MDIITQVKKRILVVFLLLLFLVSISSAQANWFTDLFKENLAGQAYSSNYAGYDKEEITCYFSNSNNEETCYSRKAQCSGIGSCTIEVGGQTGEKLTWRNTCSNEYSIITIDGEEKEIEFNCDEKNTQTITCVFNDAEQEHTCSASVGSCTGLEECSFEAESNPGQRIMFTSTCGDYGYLTFSEDDEVSFECGNIRTERDICDFEGEYGYCMALGYQGVSCTGQGRCLTSITGPLDDRVRWKTDNNLYGYSLLDGTNEYITFSNESQDEITEQVTCQFTNSDDVYTCESDYGKCSNSPSSSLPEVGDDWCSIYVEAEDGVQIKWTSDFPGSISKLTRQDGKDETILFKTSENCTNEADDDNDGLVDCEDDDCLGYIDEGQGTICGPEGNWLEYDFNDLEDNDDDRRTDCNDTDDWDFLQSFFGPELEPISKSCEYPEQTCNDNFDNDGDGDIDCLDDDCFTSQYCKGEYTCYDGLDNDNNGLTDCEDYNCSGRLGLIEGGSVGDVYCEYGTEQTCDDGFDNDADGLVDCEDDDCYDDAVCWEETVTCNFPDSSEDYDCIYTLPETMETEVLCSGSPSCSGTLSGFDEGQEFRWSSSGFLAEPSLTYFDNQNDNITFTESINDITQRITCSFSGIGTEEKKCYYEVIGSGIPEQILGCDAGSSDSCSFEFTYPEGTSFSWSSEYGDANPLTTTISSDSQQIVFSNQITEDITCVFDDGSGTLVEHSCSGHLAGQVGGQTYGCRGMGSCTFTLEGQQGENYEWTSSVPDTSNKITTFNGTDKTLKFISPKYIEAEWTCNDGFYVDSATNPTPITKAQWLDNYIEPSCSDHGGISTYNLIEDTSGDTLIGHAFSMVFGDEKINEKFTCVFDNVNSVQECYSEKGRCSGLEKCTFDISGEEQETFTVKSSIVGSEPYTGIVDGEDEMTVFSNLPELEEVEEEVTCVFNQNDAVEQMCHSSKGECFGINRCSVVIKGQMDETVTWKSTVSGSDDVETKILGKPKTIEFVEQETALPVEENTEQEEQILPGEFKESGPVQVEGPPENCTNGFDDDEDGLIDCADPQCELQEICEYPEQTCDDNFDNDGDGKTDLDDDDCVASLEVTCIFEQGVLGDCKYIKNNQEYIGCSSVEQLSGNVYAEGGSGGQLIEDPNPGDPDPEDPDPEEEVTCSFTLEGMIGQEITWLGPSESIASPSSTILEDGDLEINLYSQPGSTIPTISKEITCSFTEEPQSENVGSSEEPQGQVTDTYSCSYSVIGSSEQQINTGSTNNMQELNMVCSAVSGSECSATVEMPLGTTLSLESDYGVSDNSVVIFENTNPETIYFEQETQPESQTNIEKTITCSFGQEQAEQMLGQQQAEQIPGTQPSQGQIPQQYTCYYSIMEQSSETIPGPESEPLSSNQQEQINGNTQEQIINNVEFCSASDGQSCSATIEKPLGTTLSFESDYGLSNNPTVVFENSNPRIIDFEGGSLLTRYSWVCDNGHNVEYANLGDGLPGRRKGWWINQAEEYCAPFGGLYELTSEPPLIGETPTTGNIIYKPRTYTGWVFYQLGLIG